MTAGRDLNHSLNGLGEAVGAMRDHQCGGAGNHPVVIVKEVLLQTQRTTITEKFSSADVTRYFLILAF